MVIYLKYVTAEISQGIGKTSRQQLNRMGKRRRN
jgi:hypothetical protein